MFERRLRWFVVGMGALALLITWRLADIQLVHAASYETLADRQLTQPIRLLRSPRGPICDRNGQVLVRDEPSFDISIHYAVLSGDDGRYLEASARQLRRRGDLPADEPLAAGVQRLREQIARMWQRLAEWSGTPESELLERAARIRDRIERIKRAVTRQSPTVQSLREENLLHPVLEGAGDELALQVRLEFERFPWIRTVPSTRRVAHDADAFVHVLGTLGQPTHERIESDRLADDELRALTAQDVCGVSGIERMAESALRGMRGRIIEDFDGQVIERLEPQPGRELRLTLDARLQKHALAVLGDAVERSEHPAGGAAVVIDCATRDVLALVSYPTYPIDGADLAALHADRRRTPLRFRAVANDYPPGSTCKVITLYGGLSEGVIRPGDRIHCTGHLLSNQPGMFRCWIYNQYPGVTHDMRGFPDGLNASDALRNSCNIYFFTVGDRLGPERLASWFATFGFGRSLGAGLIEESVGVTPTPEWIAEHRPQEPRLTAADAWNFSIGQGEVTATPLQTANVMAAIVNGRWQRVYLARDTLGRPVGPPDPPPVDLDERLLKVIREGLWRVVNERGGTAHDAKLRLDDYELCGKTGSAQTVPLVLNTRYFFEWPDGRREERVAIDREDALAHFAGEAAPPRLVGWRANDRFPAWKPEEKLPAHAWFIGYTQPATTPRGAAPRDRSYAICVLIEFAGSGGQVAAPVARDIAEFLLGLQPEWG